MDTKSPHVYPPNKPEGESNDGDYGEANQPKLNAFGQREGELLKPVLLPRHIAMISIGGVIGTGLFVGTAGALHGAGPLGLILGYLLMGSVCFAMMMCLGEMIVYIPMPGGHIKLAERFVGKPLSLAVGYNYTFGWLITLPAELSAAALLTSFWTDINHAVFITVYLIIVVFINLLGTRAYGEAEFAFASIKVITIVCLIILSFLIDLGIVGKQGRIGFRYWKNPGALVQYSGIPGSWGRFLGFFSVLIQATFSYSGTEIVAMTAAEARNPRKTIKSAIKKVWVRILVFYLLGTLCIGLICPYNAPELTVGAKTNRSPFVIAIRLAGIKALPSIINGCLITSAVSAGSSDMYTASRAMYGLALAGQLPRVFARTSKKGLPYVAVGTAILFSFLAYLDTGSSSAKVFGWFANMTSAGGLLSWWSISLMYMRFHKAMQVQGYDRQTHLPFRASLQPYLAYWVFFWTSIVLIFCGFTVFLSANAPFDVSSFVTTYFPLPMFALLFFGSYFFIYGKGRSIVSLRELDLVTGIKEIEAAEYDEPPPRNVWEKFWQWIS